MEDRKLSIIVKAGGYPEKSEKPGKCEVPKSKETNTIPAHAIREANHKV